jgi:hypothetical protein
MQSQGGGIQTERKLSGWLLVLPPSEGRTGGKLHWFWGKKLRQINMESITKRVRLPLPCEIFIGSGYVAQEAEQRGGQEGADLSGSRSRELISTRNQSSTACY